jgi:hypothetical protein
MELAYIKAYYGRSASINQRVTVDGKPGIIVADKGHYLGVNFDEDKPSTISNCHPTWRVDYLEMGTARKQTKAQARYQRYLEVSDQFDSFLHFLQAEGDVGAN